MVNLNSPDGDAHNPSSYMGGRELSDKFYRFLARQLPARGRLIDLGCGRGRWMEFAASRGLQVEGVDSDAWSVEECRSRGLKATRQEAIQFLRQNSAPGASVISALHLIEHLKPTETLSLMEAMVDALCPDGLVIIVTPNFRDWRIASEVFWLDPTHVRPYPRPLLESMAANLGLTVTLSRSVGYIPIGKKSAAMRPINRIRFGGEYDRMNSIVIAKKERV